MNKVKTMIINIQGLGKILTRILIICSILTLQGCFLFGSDDNNSSAPDVCEDVFNNFVSQDKDGIGVTSRGCIESPRGEWIDGRCYCAGAEE